MSFLERSNIKNHLSTKSIINTHHKEPLSSEASLVILRDGNLITLPAKNPADQEPETHHLD